MRSASPTMRFASRRAAVLLLLPPLPLLPGIAEQALHLGAQFAGAVGIEEGTARLAAGGGVAQLERMRRAAAVAVARDHRVPAARFAGRGVVDDARHARRDGDGGSEVGLAG